MPPSPPSPSPSDPPSQGSPEPPSHGKKRKQSDIDSELAASSRQPTDPLVRIGKHLTRAVDMFHHPIDIIRYGLAFDEDAEGVYESDDIHKYEAFKALLDMDPDIEDTLYNQGTKSSTIVAMGKKLHDGQKAAYSEDAHKIKGTIVDWLSPLPSLSHVTRRTVADSITKPLRSCSGPLNYPSMTSAYPYLPLPFLF
ncbi:hypothetical protein JAAARDRAFT_50659 [Jaapia argillacea MUCL 33604]|uniref:Uncharacterized protein n=1 Tax=Jaapia argillacea MUCL 33604 TaxID=933084 RepID=A0A067PCH5_9AGAM|nr:hypothetical protein JAAARDRAFT_50659 [Jaapia argillacea MUCL 33604]